MSTASILTQLFNGLQFGVLLFLVSSGLTLIFGVVNFLNLAHGAFYMLGAFVCASCSAWTGSFIYGIFLTVPIMMLSGLLFERIFACWLYKTNHLGQLLATFGISIAADAAVRIIWGAHSAQVSLPHWLRGYWLLPGGGTISSYRLLIVFAGVLVMILLFWFVNRTRHGALLRAAAVNPERLELLGVNTRDIFMSVFVLGAILSGLAGMIVLPITGASVGMGQEIVIMAFIVTVVGGIGSVQGAFIAALALGILDTMGRAFSGNMVDMFADVGAAERFGPVVSAICMYGFFVCVLFFRPQGLFPPPVRQGQ